MFVLDIIGRYLTTALTYYEGRLAALVEKSIIKVPQKAEYLFNGELLEQGMMSVKVLKTNDICTA